MNITKKQFKQIVKEEVAAVLSEGSTADRKWRDNQANPDHGKKGAPDAAAIDALEPHDITNDLDDFIRFNTTPGYEDERVPGKTAHQRKRADLPPEEPKYDDSHLRALGYLEELQNEDVRALRRTYQEYAHWLRSRPNDANKPTIDSLSLYLISTQPKSKTTMKYNPSFGNGDLADEIANSGQLKSAAEALEVDAKALYAKRPTCE